MPEVSVPSLRDRLDFREILSGLYTRLEGHLFSHNTKTSLYRCEAPEFGF